jgi:beta-glucanase (GH16 family)
MTDMAQRIPARRTNALAAIAGLLMAVWAIPAIAQTACAGSYIFCDDFAGTSVDTAKWTVADLNIASKYPVRPENIALTDVDDHGTTASVVDAMSFGDEHVAAPRQGGILISKLRYGGGRYEVRMKNLTGPGGCSCFWNYYDSRYEPGPSRKRMYTEIDIEMPAHMTSPPAWRKWRRIVGLNTWSHTDSDRNATYINHRSTIDPFDGEFHVFRFDWHDGSDGKRSIEWYIDGELQASTRRHVSNAPAQIWVGTWPAPWPGMEYSFDIKHQYIDWVRISAL